MGKSIKSEMVPLVKRPIEEILTVSRAAGRKAFATRETVEAAWMQARHQWIGAAFPTGEGISEDQFGDIVAKACDAFEEGVDEYIVECEANAPRSEDVASKLERELRDEQFDKMCAAEILYWAAGIFEAIKKAAMALPKGCNRGHIIQLAECGDYLTSDRAELLGYIGGMNAGANHE
ncbi:hypothetical protein [Caballeronia sp. 15711]|uniref:hypothetical protein n=1 Tax=Caballeronia sp. 15711 TaxID=3391029 RepID=UPI0039E69503